MLKMSNCPWGFIVTFTGFASVLGTSTHAQQGVGLALEEIIVTAQRREQSLQDTPVSVSAVTGEAIVEMGLTDLFGLGHTLPNVEIGGGGLEGPEAASMRIRGIGGVRRDLAIEVAGAIYVDDVYFSQADGALLNALDIERVEVLRGPQGTLFGKNATAGAVRLFTHRPEYGVTNGSISLTAGESGRGDIEGHLNYGFSDTAALRLTLASNSRDGYITREIDGVKTGNVDDLITRLKFGFAPYDRVAVLLSADYTDKQTNGPPRDILDLSSGICGGRPGTNLDTIGGNPQRPGPACGLVGRYNAGPPSMGIFPPSVRGTGAQWNHANAGAILTPDPYTVEGGDSEATMFESTGFSAEIDFELTESLTLTSLTGYRQNEFLRHFDYDGSTRFDLYTNNVAGDYESLSQEFQLTGAHPRVDWVAGVYFFEEEALEMNTQNGQRGFVSPVDLVRNTSRFSEVSTMRAFAQATFDLTQSLSLTAGAGYTEDDKSFRVTDDTVLRGQPLLSADTWDDTQSRISLEYRWSDSVMAYVSYSEGWKSGGFNSFVLEDNDRNPNGIADPGTLTAGCFNLAQVEGFPITNPDSSCAQINYAFLPFGTEALESREIGVRSEIFEGRLRLNATYFTSDYDNIQQTNIQLTGRPFIRNTGSADYEGYEIEGVLAVAEGLQLNFNVGGLDPSRADGNAVTNVVESSYNLGVRYFNGLNNGGSLTLSANYGWQDDVLTDTGPPETFREAYALASFRLTYSSPGDRWDASVFCTNCADEPYNYSVLNFASANQTLFQDFEMRARLREWGATFKYYFGER